MKALATWLVDSAARMEAFGAWLAPLLQAGDTVFLRGEMGSGKTTLVRGVARGLGYPGRVSSPTFTLLNIYETTPILYHIDFYRIKPYEVEDLGLDDLAGGVMLLEWPEIAADFVREADFILDIALTDGDYDLSRMITLSALVPERFIQFKGGRECF